MKRFAFGRGWRDEGKFQISLKRKKTRRCHWVNLKWKKVILKIEKIMRERFSSFDKEIFRFFPILIRGGRFFFATRALQNISGGKNIWQRRASTGMRCERKFQFSIYCQEVQTLVLNFPRFSNSLRDSHLRNLGEIVKKFIFKFSYQRSSFSQLNNW